MKKLLLLTVFPLLLAGCSLEPNKQDFNWKELKENEYVEVHYGETSKRYNATADIQVKYHFVAYDTVAEVQVEERYTNGYTHTDYYIGTDITVYHYEV